MTVKELTGFGFEAAALPEPEREIYGVYIGDLLSWVMGRAQSGNAWLTIMSNINVLAVATLSDTSCVIMCEGVKPDGEVLKTAEQKNINILTTDKNAFEAAVALKDII